MRYVIRGDDAHQDTPIGGKAHALAALSRAGMCVPRWIVLTPAAFDDSLSATQRQAVQRCAVEQLCEIVEQIQPHASVSAEVEAALRDLCSGDESVAVRSSAADEDGRKYSFAGQLDSFLHVPPTSVMIHVRAVWRSAFSQRVVAYRRAHGLALPPPAPAVLIQRMVHADAAGVAFGTDPTSGRRDVAVISAVRGAGSPLVSGESTGDTYYVTRDGGVRCVHTASSEGVLDEGQAREIANLVWQAGRIFGRPQDVEWAIETSRLYLLQSRPITTPVKSDALAGARTLWDNSNVTESYHGVTTPLTFSFARRAYEHVYRQFCRLLRVPEAKVAAHDEVFRNMIGLVRGRVYYNLLNWYRALALLPGFTVNRRFMEQMMGVREGLPDDIAAKLGRATRWQRWQDSWHLLRSALALVTAHFTLARRTQRFYGRLNRALGPTLPKLDTMSAAELATYYRGLEDRLLPRWDAPLVNDFLAMIFYGVLRRLTEKWCAPGASAFHNDLLCGEGGIISAEPALRTRQLAEVARSDPELVAALSDAPLPEIEQALERAPAFRAQLEAYIDKFGDRCLEELKLESPTLHDDPLMLMRSVGRLARRLAQGTAPPPGRDNERRHAAERRLHEVFRGRPIRRGLYHWVLKNARERLRDRENLRFERTRLFGRARRIFLALGRRLHAQGLLEEARDVFYLEVDEVLGALGPTTTGADLRARVQARQAEFEGYRHTPPPPDRFETCGPVDDVSVNGDAAPAGSLEQGTRQGLGCSPGVVRGLVCVVTDPRNAAIPQGAILVAKRTDPGWVTLFAGALGIVVERGSPLSHSAIVARELGLTLVVAVEGATDWLKDGDWVEVDGSHGIVKRIAGAERPAPQTG